MRSPFFEIRLKVKDIQTAVFDGRLSEKPMYVYAEKIGFLGPHSPKKSDWKWKARGAAGLCWSERLGEGSRVVFKQGNCM